MRHTPHAAIYTVTAHAVTSLKCNDLNCKDMVTSHLQRSTNQLLIKIYREQAISWYKAAACQVKLIPL